MQLVRWCVIVKLEQTFFDKENVMENGKNDSYAFPTNTPEPRATEEEINTLKEKIRLKAIEHSRSEHRYAFWRDTTGTISVISSLGMVIAIFAGHRGFAIGSGSMMVLISLIKINVDDRWKRYAELLSDLRLVEEMM